jgi:hypothetical protein
MEKDVLDIADVAKNDGTNFRTEFGLLIEELGKNVQISNAF